MPHGSMRSYMEVNPDKDRSSWVGDIAANIDGFAKHALDSCSTRPKVLPTCIA
jgi:hypothetical protein